MSKGARDKIVMRKTTEITLPSGSSGTLNGTSGDPTWDLTKASECG